jgi:hypothetical protein
VLPPERALRKTNKRQMGAIKTTITEAGFIRPILVDQDIRIIAGHNAWLAAKELGLAEVPVVRIDHLRPEQIKLYQIADNKTAELSAWDDDLLFEAFESLNDLDLSGVLELNLEHSAFTSAEIDRILERNVIDEKGSDNLPPLEPVAVTQLGDLYDLDGQHKLICGNALEAETYVALLGEEKVQLGVTDPPYGVKISGHVSGLGKTKHREFVMGGEELAGEKLTAFLATAFGHILQRFSDDVVGEPRLRPKGDKRPKGSPRPKGARIRR